MNVYKDISLKKILVIQGADQNSRSYFLLKMKGFTQHSVQITHKKLERKNVDEIEEEDKLEVSRGRVGHFFFS